MKIQQIIIVFILVISIFSLVSATNDSYNYGSGSGGGGTTTICSSECLSWGEWSDCINGIQTKACLQLEGNCSGISMPTQGQTCGNEPPQQEVNNAPTTQSEGAISPGESCMVCGCPSACTQITDDPNCAHTCSCDCPPNYGLCYNDGIRNKINDTEVYCLGGILLEQKQNDESCQNSFECVNNFCSKDVCYDISSKVAEQETLIQKIINFLKQLFGFG